jgi:pyruvate/2-oxoglutarate dehydrogenase complex dihydrolipoamide acyltransferase (E2) component
MPGVASDAHQGVLSSWLIDETDAFDAAQTIAYVETSTLLLSVESGRPGVLLKTLVEPGTQVGVGMPIGVIGDRDERVPDLDTLLAELGVNGLEEVAPTPAPLAPELSEPGPEPAWEPAPAQDASRPTHDLLRTTIRVDRLERLMAGDRPVALEHLVQRAVDGAHRVLPELDPTLGPDGVRREGGIAVSYPGRYGLDESVPVVTAPEVVALSVGGVRDEPVVSGGTVVAGRVLTLTLSVDHDLVDDRLAARWLGVLAALLERPEWLHD